MMTDNDMAADNNNNNNKQTINQTIKMKSNNCQ